MPREEIQTTNPNGIRDRRPNSVPAALAYEDGAPPYAPLPSLRRARNLPATLACALGALAFGLVVIGFLAQHYEPHWLGPFGFYPSVGGWFGSALGFSAFFLGAAATGRGYEDFYWPHLGMLLGLCAMLGALFLFFDLMRRISSC